MNAPDVQKQHGCFKQFRPWRWTAFWYVVCGCVIFLLVDNNAAIVNRLNFLKLYDIHIFLAEKRGLPLTREDVVWGKRYYQAVIARSPRESLFLGNLAYCYYYLGDLKSAFKTLSKAVSLEKGMYFYYQDMGLIALNWGQLEQSQQYYEQALTIVPVTLRIFEIMGKRLSVPSQMTNVVTPLAAMYQQAEIDKGDILEKLAEITYFRHDYAKMITYALAGVQVQPQNQRLNYLAGLGYLSLNQPQKALAFFDRAIRLDPKNLEAYYYRSRCHRALGQEERMKRDAQIVARLQAEGIQPQGPIRDGTRLHFCGRMIFLLHQLAYNKK